MASSETPDYTYSTSHEPVAIRAATVLPAERRNIELHTADGLTLVGEFATPAGGRAPKATLVTLHPLPTHGGFMDSHVYRKASFRLPALADIAVLRFNTRGTCSPRGCSEGAFDGGEAERLDLQAAVDWAVAEGLQNIWLVGWSFGTELCLKYGAQDPVADLIEGAILLSPPLHRADDSDLDAWAASRLPLKVLVPEFDDYLVPEDARARFARVPQADVTGVEGAKHLWVGEKYAARVLDEIVAVVRPDSPGPLPTEWAGPAAVAPSPMANG
ncbi:alpha/beta fold hydrolase [Arthrobacter agilis]|uniref:alpha/beta hydrolase n=1 Tax=Arthrobacter agilis TaxID=37921 RepID=UPI000B352DF9|nr:alpha/beta fold hydrolase [Arthrobacter agilis]OUM44106.1 alpha/beta hydrolase [Arthrobacter agilis]PPB46481.1 alpha/beta hydrolase [Arthrobacter agilis]TPV23864.1 alpha/beta fold hydrolase [Arthrobacter agilis]VDR32607.1 Alpha/beta hydrolase family [Arthrobacter agilis]